MKELNALDTTSERNITERTGITNKRQRQEDDDDTEDIVKKRRRAINKISGEKTEQSEDSEFEEKCDELPIFRRLFSQDRSEKIDNLALSSATGELNNVNTQASDLESDELIQVPDIEKDIIRSFYNIVISRFASDVLEKVQFIVVGHVVPTLPFYLEALSKIGQVAAVVPKGSVQDKNIMEWLEHQKYSIKLSVLLDKRTELLKERFNSKNDKKDRGVESNSLERLTSKELLALDGLYFIQEWTKKSQNNIIIIDIGGYFSHTVKDLSLDMYQELKSKILGFVEDTENGHQKYEKAIKEAEKQNLPLVIENKIKECFKLDNSEYDVKRPKILSKIKQLSELIEFTEEEYRVNDESIRRLTAKNIPPIITVARSQIKDSEDYNVGKAIVDATDHILRVSDYTHLAESKIILIIGYGKIGSAAARVASEKTRGAVLVCETSHVRALKASAHSFKLVTIAEGLKQADIIISCTGNKCLTGLHINLLKNNVYIASCTSREDEFHAEFISKLDAMNKVEQQHIFRYQNGIKVINFLNNGNSVNFVEKAVHGYFIHGVLASLVVSAIEIIKNRDMRKLKHGCLNDFNELVEDGSREASDNASYQSIISGILMKQKLRVEPIITNYMPIRKRLIVRDKDIGDLKKMLNTNPIVCVIGGRKYGKSQVVEGFYNLNKYKYDITWKFSCSTPINVQIKMLHGEIQDRIQSGELPMSQDMEKYLTSKDSTLFFGFTLPYLLIFEDIHKVDPEYLRKYVPSITTNNHIQHVILTSSYHEDYEYAQCLELKPFPYGELLKFLINDDDLWEKNKELLNSLIDLLEKQIPNTDNKTAEYVGVISLFSSYIRYQSVHLKDISFLNEIKDIEKIEMFLEKIIESLKPEIKKILASFYILPEKEFSLLISEVFLEKISDKNSIEELKKFGFIEKEENGDMFYPIYGGCFNTKILEACLEKEYQLNITKKVTKRIFKKFCTSQSKDELYYQTSEIAKSLGANQAIPAPPSATKKNIIKRSMSETQLSKETRELLREYFIKDEKELLYKVMKSLGDYYFVLNQSNYNQKYMDNVKWYYHEAYISRDSEHLKEQLKSKLENKLKASNTDNNQVEAWIKDICENNNIDSTLSKYCGSRGLFNLRKAAIEYWLNYNHQALIKLLMLRLHTIASQVSIYISIDTSEPIIVSLVEYPTVVVQKQLASLANKIYSSYMSEFNTQVTLIPLLIKESSLVYHWVGLVLEKRNDGIFITYIDSENLPVSILKKSLINQLKLLKPESKISFNNIKIEQQRYNNCGPELVENFVYYLTGYRATQEAAVYVHSLLLENTLLDQELYQLKIVENNKLIGFLSNQVPMTINRLINIGFGTTQDQLIKAIQPNISELISKDYSINGILPSNYLMDNVIGSYSKIYLQDNVCSLIASVANGLVCTSLVAIANDVSVQLLISSKDNVYTKEKAFSTDKLYQKTNFFSYLIKRVVDKLDINWQYKKLLYSQDINQFNNLVKTYNIKVNDGSAVSINIIKDSSAFRKSVLIKVHPDKGGNQEDFKFMQGLEDKFNKDIDVKRIIDNKINNVQPIIYKANIVFKTIDSIVDTMRVIYEPTVQNAKKLALDTTYLCSMYWGINSYSAIISGAEVLYNVYQSEYAEAVYQGVTIVGYMALPSAIGALGIPYLGLAYGIGIAAYSGYNVINNGYSFYLELLNSESSLRSITAYKDLAKVLSVSPLQWLYDFGTTVKGHEIEINNITLESEKAAIKTQLEAQGEFDYRLYKYIYETLLEEKYNLLNQILQNSITEEKAESLKTKHISINLGTQSYDHCMEIRDISNDEIAEHYYCYNDEEKMLDHIIIGKDNNNFKIIESFQ